ncbi:hypothetical protein NC653_015629 [Populus alba x Populus x berolinensis]|nr:hypothetical protein NC653_015629 [Populus alba x Populus x berolinensis]
MLSSNDKLARNISSVTCELKCLEILDLSNNGFKGNDLRYLNFNGNQLKGVVSVIYCVNLEFLDLGNNMIDDTFPSFLEMLPKLEVLDLSNNSLSGPLPTEYFYNFKAMMSVDQVMDYVRAKSLSTSYVYSVTMAWKVQPAWFVKMVEDSAHQNAKRLRRKNAPRNGEDDSGSRGRCEKASLDNAFNTNISFYEPSPV